MQKISKRMTVAAGIVPVRLTKDGYKFLLVRSYSFWEFPKGRVEGDESLFDAAVRETQEEVGLGESDLDFKWGPISKQTDTYKKGSKYVVYFLAQTDKEDIVLPVNPEIGKQEHEEYRWFFYDEAKRALNERLNKILDWANEVIKQ